MPRSASPLAVLAVVAVAAAGPAAGQTGGRLYFSGGLQIVETDELNRLLDAQGLPTFDEEHLTAGLGLDRRSGRWLVGAEAALLLAEEETGGGFDRSLGGRFGLLQGGYVFPLVGGLRVYPLAGVGWSDLDFTTSRDGTVPFDDLVEGPGPGSEVSTGGLILQPGLGVDLVGGGLTVGVRGGYTFAPGEAEWDAQDVTVEGGPDIGLEGAFLRATVGFSNR